MRDRKMEEDENEIELLKGVLFSLKCRSSAFFRVFRVFRGSHRVLVLSLMPLSQPLSSRSLRARWVFPVCGPPLRDAAVTVYEGRIIAVGSPAHGVPIE